MTPALHGGGDKFPRKGKGTTPEPKVVAALGEFCYWVTVRSVTPDKRISNSLEGSCQDPAAVSGGGDRL